MGSPSARSEPDLMSSRRADVPFWLALTGAWCAPRSVRKESPWD